MDSNINSMSNIKQHFFTIKELTAREIKRKYARSYLGIFWSMLHPLLYMVLMSMIFSTMYGKRHNDFALYFLTGYLIWSLFSNATKTSMTALWDNKAFFARFKQPKYLFVFSRIYTAFVNFLFSCIAYIIVTLFFGVKFSPSFFMIFADVFLCMLFIIGLSMILSLKYIDKRDIKYIYTNFLYLLIHLVGLYYPMEILPENVRNFVNLIPVYLYIKTARECILEGVIPDEITIISLVAWSLGVLFLGMIYYKSHEEKILKKL
ncbi:ABC-2 type transport system permease protein/lipopolysaccharide transport system permease protein [Acetitomaculum ruminis DSM 5522]|uniref:Transport permease protein n=1 Tax=Acetitomaculum ruminis DSM 5522 TaxID=1120918 RepID=A0A1I0VLX0_9FIRM|nr:ABC transporter permease [Acetitomaculum ruminis]SFA76586.1 ABC-2 type transport system permease protein/lipopolysaccharide transport system permease protein [Acetitomaculum ruminis DSM 5522]